MTNGSGHYCDLSFGFFMKLAAKVSFSSRLGRNMTAGSGGREEEDLRSSKYKFLVLPLICTLQLITYEEFRQIEDGGK